MYLPPHPARETFDCAGAKIFFVFSIFDDHAVLCAVKSDKQKVKDKTFINRWSASQIKHITAKSNSMLRQKLLFDIDYQSFAVGESLFVSRCRRSRWLFVFNEYLASTLSIHFWIVVNVKLNKYHCFGKCNTSLIPEVPILGFVSFVLW